MKKNHKEIRYNNARWMLQLGKITSIGGIAEHVKGHTLAEDSGVNYPRIKKLLTDAGECKIREVFKLSVPLDIEFKSLLYLLANEFLTNEASKTASQVVSVSKRTKSKKPAGMSVNRL